MATMGFYMGVWDTNMDPHAGTASTSHIKPSPHFLLTNFVLLVI